MTNCNKEIIGVKQIALYINKGARFERPNVLVENEVNLITTEDSNYFLEDKRSQIKWERTISFSSNYKQNYLDEFTFLLHGFENDIPALIDSFRNNRLGFVVQIITTGNNKLVFQAPVFLNKENTKEINSHSWQVSFAYRLPTFKDKLTLLDVSSAVEPEEIENNTEIVGVRKIALYINKNVRIRRPNPAIENEVDVIAHAIGSFVINEVIEQPRWERSTTYSSNYQSSYVDTFSFILHGIENNIPGILESLRNNRLGYVAEIVTTGGKSFVFPSPVFLENSNVKEINSHSWQVSLTYRTPTFEDKLKKLNTLLMTSSFITLAPNRIWGDGVGNALVSR
jgi:hypothetical protein